MSSDHLSNIAKLTSYFENISAKGIERGARDRPTLNADYAEEEWQQFYNALDNFINMVLEAYEYQKKIASGDLTAEVGRKNAAAMPLRALQSSLKHLTWQASQVADGDLNQEVHFLGDFAQSFNRMILSLREKEKMQSRLIQAQKMESIGGLVEGLAHEINTPSQYITTNLDFIQESCADTGEIIRRLTQVIKEQSAQNSGAMEQILIDMEWDYLASELPGAIQQTREGIDRIAKIVETMKDFAQPKGVGKELQDINQILEKAITLTSGQWRDVAELEFNLAASLPTISVETDKLEQVFVNVLVNAVQAISEQNSSKIPGEKGLVTVSSRLEKEAILICFSDTGVGIKPEIMDRIFDPFFTTREVGQRTGQGLAISYKIIVEQHKGTIAFQSEVGNGTKCLIRLPLD
jgi:signal transduction histidine kinase